MNNWIYFIKYNHHLINFFFSLPPAQLAKYPAWLIVFLGKIILPMIGMVIIAIKIIMKNGKDMSRELLGVNFQSTISKSKSLNSPLGEEISLKTFFDHSNVWNPLSIIKTGYLYTPPFHKTSSNFNFDDIKLC